MDATQRALEQQLKSILTLANAVKHINLQLKEDDYGSAIIIEYNVIEECVYKMLSVVPEVKQLRFVKDPEHFGLFKELETLVKAIQHNHVLFQECDITLYQTIKGWVIERNTLTHELLEENRLEDFEKASKRLALQGKSLVKQLILDLRHIRARARNLNHLSYRYEYHLFSSIMKRFEREQYLR
jgi:hypothetical protein